MNNKSMRPLPMVVAQVSPPCHQHDCGRRVPAQTGTPLHEDARPRHRALGLRRGHSSTWGAASVPSGSRKPRGLPACGLFCPGEKGDASETAPPCLAVGLFLCLRMFSSSVLTAVTSPAGGARPLEPCSLGGKGFLGPHAHLGSGRRGWRNSEHVALGAPLGAARLPLLPANKSFLLSQGQEPVSNCGTKRPSPFTESGGPCLICLHFARIGE